MLGMSLGGSCQESYNIYMPCHVGHIPMTEIKLADHICALFLREGVSHAHVREIK